MKVLRRLSHFLTWMAAAGLCCPSLARGNETALPVVATLGNKSGVIHDVSLSAGGVLIGQTLDESMRPIAGAKITIQSGGHPVAHTTSDANGVFAVAGLRGGVHQVIANDAVHHCRLWAPGTAPPGATNVLRFIPGKDNVVRGQWGPPIHLGHRAGTWATNPWIIGGIVATAIAVPIALHNLDDDDDSGS